MANVSKDKPFAASISIVAVAALALVGVEIEEPAVQALVETGLAVVAGVAAFVAAIRVVVLRLRG